LIIIIILLVRSGVVSYLIVLSMSKLVKEEGRGSEFCPVVKSERGANRVKIELPTGYFDENQGISCKIEGGDLDVESMVGSAFLHDDRSKTDVKREIEMGNDGGGGDTEEAIASNSNDRKRRQADDNYKEGDTQGQQLNQHPKQWDDQGHQANVKLKRVTMSPHLQGNQHKKRPRPDASVPSKDKKVLVSSIPALTPAAASPSEPWFVKYCRLYPGKNHGVAFEALFCPACIENEKPSRFESQADLKAHLESHTAKGHKKYKSGGRQGLDDKCIRRGFVRFERKEREEALEILKQDEQEKESKEVYKGDSTETSDDESSEEDLMKKREICDLARSSNRKHDPKFRDICCMVDANMCLGDGDSGGIRCPCGVTLCRDCLMMEGDDLGFFCQGGGCEGEGLGYCWKCRHVCEDDEGYYCTSCVKRGWTPLGNP
jgi:hypothetical protein